MVHTVNIPKSKEMTATFIKIIELKSERKREISNKLKNKAKG